MINLRNINETIKFDFQQVFDENSSQEELFGTVVQPVLSRFTDDLQNVSIFAYGPTGSGKYNTTAQYIKNSLSWLRDIAYLVQYFKHFLQFDKYFMIINVAVLIQKNY